MYVEDKFKVVFWEDEFCIILLVWEVIRFIKFLEEEKVLEVLVLVVCNLSSWNFLFLFRNEEYEIKVNRFMRGKILSD